MEKKGNYIMRLNKIILVLMLLFSVIYANQTTTQTEQININFKGLKISDLIKITAKIIDKNILLTYKVNGTVDFISNKPVYKEDILNILIYVLEGKGYTLIDNKGILRVIRINDVSKYNAPVYSDTKNVISSQMLTEVFTIQHSNVDYISSKIRHLISKSAKLVTDKNSNSIVITDFLSNIQTIKKVINIISEDAKKTIKVIQLNNIQANTVASDLRNVAKTVFNEKIEKEKVSILVNKDTNSIMFVGKKKNVEFLKKYLLNIETKGSLVEKIVEVVYLKNAEAKNVIKILSSIISNRKYKDANIKPFTTTDEESNSIILMGPKKELKYYKKLITQLDIDKQQVYVKARIIEISELKTRDVGIKYGLIGGRANDSSGLMTFAANMGGSAIAIDTSSMGLSVPNINKGLALGATINLLNQNGAADIVSEPSLLCINNKQSSIYVGETRSIKTGTTTTTGGSINDTYKREDIGLTLKIKPRISNGNKVLLEINTKLEDVSQSNGANGQPNTSKKDLETTAIVNNGESVILGGYIKEKRENTEDKVPFFGDIPILGALFRSNREVNDKINLVIIITPYIIPKSKDLTYVRDQLAHLKLLENKYTKDTILRLRKAQLLEKHNDMQRKQEILELEKQEQEFKSKKQKFDDVIDIDDKKKDLKLHNQRIKEMFGI
jgi:general secretion pathway protein D